MDDICHKPFIEEFDVFESDLKDRDIMWNFRGEISIPLEEKPYPIMFMQGEKYGEDIIGVGYHFRIKKDKTADIEKRVYRKNKREKPRTIQPAD
jgi:hypothetical protein